jgi:hypothetical protein
MNQKLTDEITSVLSKVPIVENLSRKKFISLFILGLIKSRNVQFCEVAVHLNDQAKLTSNEVRIQDFFRQVELDYFYVALLLVSLLAAKEKLRLCIDRTEWDFGGCRVNILMVVVGYGSCQLPLYWQMLDNNSGNSCYEDRKELIESCVEVVGKERIGLIIGDREFVGHKWFKYMKDKGLNFVMRLPKHHLIHRLDGRKQTVAELSLSTQKPLILMDCLVDGVVGHIWVKALPDGDFLFLFGTVKAEYMGQLYRKRWSIESVFQNLKQRGFNLEKTHLKDFTKLKKLIGMVSIAYGMCLSMGIYYHSKVQTIKKKKHGYKTNSFARKGINLIRELFRENNHLPIRFENRILSLLRWIKIQVTRYQHLKIVG